MGAAARRHLAVVKEGTRRVVGRMVSLYCQECGGTFRYRYPGTGPYRSFCRKCNPNSATWKK